MASVERVLTEVGDNPLSSRFLPRVQFRFARAPASRYVLNSTFSGPPLQLENPLQLTVPPRQWPETEEFCEISWDDLEIRLGNSKRMAR
jgi:hypothetical protein